MTTPIPQNGESSLMCGGNNLVVPMVEKKLITPTAFAAAEAVQNFYLSADRLCDQHKALLNILASAISSTHGSRLDPSLIAISAASALKAGLAAFYEPSLVEFFPNPQPIE
jgi:hypothetical protein